LSALLCKERFNCFEPGDQGGTFCGNPLMAALGLAVLNEVCQAEFLAAVRQRSRYLAAGLRRLVKAHDLLDERGAGLLRALVLPGNHAEQVVNAARNLAPTGLLVNAPRPNLLRLMPALNITEAEIDQGLELLGQALRQTPPGLSSA